jgi:hypothetical protein
VFNLHQLRVFRSDQRVHARFTGSAGQEFGVGRELERVMGVGDQPTGKPG